MIYLKEAILHYYQASTMEKHYSESPLEIENEYIHTYLEKHIERCRKDFSAKEGIFFPEAVTREKCQAFLDGEINFLTLSTYLAEQLFLELAHASDDTSRDVIVCHYEDAKNEPHLAFLLCKNKAAYTHHFLEEEGKAKIALVSHKEILPSENQRMEAFFLLNLKSMQILLSDKVLKIDGQKVALLEELVLGCSTEPSSRENYKFINKTLDDICQEYAKDSLEVLRRTKVFLEEKSRDEDKIELSEIASEAFPDSMAMQKRFKHFSDEAGLPQALSFEHEHIEKETLTQKLVTDTGISLEIPLNYLNDEDYLSFQRDGEGQVMIILKGITKLEHK